MKGKLLVSLCLAGLSASAMFAQGYKDGIEYYKADRYANAKELLARNLNAPETDKAASYYYLGMIAIQEKNVQEAKSIFEKGVGANPKYPYNYVGLGYIELSKGDKKAAEKLFKEGTGMAKKDAGVEVAVARAYYMVDPVEYAKDIDKHLNKAIRTDDKEADVYVFQGDMAADKKDWGTSTGYYEMATNYAPDATEAYVKGADTYMQVNPQYGINLLKTLLARNPNSALGRRELANTYYDLNRYKEAAEEYGRYINNPNHFARDEDRYAFLLFYGENYKEGYDYATKLLNNDPTNFSAQRFQFMNAAQIPAMADQLLPLAEKLYATHKANKDNELAPIDYTLISDELTRAKKPEEAVEVLNEAIAVYPKNASFNKGLAMTYIDAGKYDMAAKEYANYMAKLEKPDFSDFLQEATLCYYAAISEKDNAEKRDQLFAESQKYAKKAAEANADNYRPNKILGDIARAKATKATLESAAAPDYQAAVDKLEKMEDRAKYARDAKELYNYLGNYYLSQKNVDRAKTYFNKYLEYDPDNAEYKKFVNSLK